MAHGGREEERLGSLMWGIGLMLVGAVILLRYLDIVPFSMWHSWWPLIVVMMGVAQLVMARGPRGIGKGVSTLLFGAWFYVAANQLWGFTWRTSWPLALVAVGAGMVVRSFAAFVMPREAAHEAGCTCGRCRGEVRTDA